MNARIVQRHEAGGSDELTIEIVDNQASENSDILIHVNASGLNHTEVMCHSSHHAEHPLLPARSGYETIEAPHHPSLQWQA